VSAEPDVAEQPITLRISESGKGAIGAEEALRIEKADVVEEYGVNVLNPQATHALLN
jgi:hypothetical protein